MEMKVTRQPHSQIWARCARLKATCPKLRISSAKPAAILAKLNRVNQRDVVTYNLAELLQRQGKFRQAKDILEPLLEHVRGEGSKSVLGATLESPRLNC